MPWNNQGGSGPGGSPWGNPRPGGPWGQPPQGGGGGRGPGGGPDLDEAIRQAQEALRRFLPGGGGGMGKWIGLGAVVVLGLWAASGIYRVQPDEQGVVMRFGAFDRTTSPGLNYHIPWPVETVTTPRVTRINRIDIGFRAPADVPLTRPVPARDVVEESLMLTGDENIIDIDFAVFWRIRDAGEYLFNTRNPDETVKSAAESVMREVVGQTPIQPALTEARAEIEQRVLTGVQFILDQYKSGVEITQVQLLKVDPPAEVIDTFRDVQRANADRERLRNEAETYRNDIIPRARGEGQRLIQEAEGYKESQVARARGEAARFLSILSAYQNAKDVTVRRLYMETMEEILRRNPKLLVDDRLQGIVPYLPLDGASRPAGATGQQQQQRPPVPPAALERTPAPPQAAQGGSR
ncbi:FtsH protease activity modulator HflK [Roseomonas sp. E05]|uniref:FtsH protease activity modulator HflK n=1 Tax=Roseomonas sp. E05 TaxID=3046310 RepID=UPI0024B8C1E9|nr:FtsH protease activity modulator HflK [Roseomonas sp. E05]MDJ0387430.1 FtsH protease activity modulator HflK [Roseomonas sp. E05]